MLLINLLLLFLLSQVATRSGGLSYYSDLWSAVCGMVPWRQDLCSSITTGGGWGNSSSARICRMAGMCMTTTESSARSKVIFNLKIVEVTSPLFERSENQFPNRWCFLWIFAKHVFIINARRTPFQAPSANVTATRVKTCEEAWRRWSMFLLLSSELCMMV